jgi:predicted unusual protein kinase regulating ubiquinone biosynthesis (AarF/ABC1/UbiB family)
VTTLLDARPRDAARLAEIAMTLGRSGVRTAVGRAPGIALRPQHNIPRALAVSLRRGFTDLGPAFVKLGQVVASSPGLFPALLSDEFRRLLDDVAPEPASVVRRVIERELGAPLHVLFSEFDDRPVAAASIAQVHRAWLHDGTAVAVKVRRPGLRRRIDRDLRLLAGLASALQHAGTVGDVANPVAIVEDLAVSLRAELDFRREANDMREFAANLRRFGHNDDIVVPDAIDGLVGERVLTMTYVEGIPVDRGDTLRAAGFDLEQLVRTGVRVWLEGALEHGLFHGDVHAGNLFVTPEGKLAFLDFGITGRLDDRTRLVLRRALPAVIVHGDYRRLVEAVFDLGAVRPGAVVDADAAAEDVARILAPLASRGIGDIGFGELLGSVVSVAGTYGVRLPRDLVLVVKQLLYFERYAKELAPDYLILSDHRILEHLLAADATEVRPEDAPAIRTRPRAVDLAPPDHGIAVHRDASPTFSWCYEGQRDELARLYSKAKRSQWNVSTDVDWSIDVDPLDTGGLASYLPMIAATSFERFDDAEKANAARHFNAWITSQFLHGEQGALLATAKLVEEVPWVEAKLYGATQVFDEARHVEVYARYLDEKLELTYPVNPQLQQLLEMIVTDTRWDVTYLGMQIIVEGIALAAFGLIHQFSTEPLIKDITRYVMADEARHVAFGALSLAGLYDDMTAAERADREEFVVEAAWLMRDRFLATEVWESLGIPASDGLRDSARSPMLQLFQRVLFAKITPNLRKIGLLSDPLIDRLVRIGAIAPDDL